MLTENEKKYCAGLIHLRAVLRKLIAAEKAEVIKVRDTETLEWTKFPITETGVNVAADFATQVDDTVKYLVGNAVLMVIYDGPYTEDNAEEIINDTNERTEEILNA